jgi:hypothetical protein
MADSKKDFLKKFVAGTVGITVGGKIFGNTATSYEKIVGAGNLIPVAVIGCNSRGAYMAGTFADALNGYKSTLWIQLGNLAQSTGRTLIIDP